MILKKTNAGSFPQLEPGTYVARLYSLIYLGTQKGEYQGTETESQKINLSFEIPSERLNMKDKDLPRSISSEFTFSFSQKSKFLPVVETLLGRKIEDDEDVDLKEVLGAECLVSVGTTSGGKAKITGVAKLMKGQKCPPQENESIIFDADNNFNPEVFSKFPKFIKEKIQAAPEYANLVVDLPME